MSLGIGAGLTIEDFEKLPESLARNHELIDGELVKMSGNTAEHNLLRDLLVQILRNHVVSERLGVIISEQEFAFQGDAHGPDVAFLNPEKASRVDRKRRVQEFVPDLAIEIVSRNDTAISLNRKARRYRKAGTQEVWVFDIEGRNALCYSDRRNVILEEDASFESELIPGFSIRIGELFDRI